MEAPHLSPREFEVLKLLVDGLQVSEVAKELFITPATVKVHVRSLYDKFCVNNRARLIKVVQELRVIDRWEGKLTPLEELAQAVLDGRVYIDVEHSHYDNRKASYRIMVNPKQVRTDQRKQA